VEELVVVVAVVVVEVEDEVVTPPTVTVEDVLLVTFQSTQSVQFPVPL
jgi:hypothetical protein